MVPVLLYYRFSERRAIATSSATSFLISLLGTLGYLFPSQAAEGIPQRSDCFGYLYIPAFVLISLSSFFTAFYGVKLAHEMEPQRLRKLFATLLVGVGLVMIFTFSL
jgi:uncharacterized membrane protein YfcA